MRGVFAVALAFLFLAPASALATERINARKWRRVKTYEMAALQKIEPLPLRQFVGVRFNYRAERILHLKPNWHYCSIWSTSGAGNRQQLDNIRVMVSTADLPYFRALPTSPETAGKFVVYGQVLQDAEANFLFLRLLGTKVKHGKRHVTVSW